MNKLKITILYKKTPKSRNKKQLNYIKSHVSVFIVPVYPKVYKYKIVLIVKSYQFCVKAFCLITDHNFVD